MTINSKLEVRNEAVRIASMLKDVDSTNIVEVSEKIEKYMLGNVDVPDFYDPNAYMRELKDMFKSQISDSGSKTYSANTANGVNGFCLGIAPESAKTE